MTESEEAIRRFLEGEEEAFSVIVRSWERKIYNLAWRMLGNREDAQDVAQETFLSVYKSMHGLRDPGSFSTWLYRITLNHCRTRRKSRPLHLSLDDRASTRPGDGESDFLPIPVASRSVEALEALDVVRKALSGLNEEHRTAIVLKEYMGLSLEELASVMDCPLSTAKSRLYNGLREAHRNLSRLGIKTRES